MRIFLAIFCLASACSLAFAANSPAVSKAYTDDRGTLHILTADGRDHTIEPKKWQAGGGFSGIQIGPDRGTVGWLVNRKLTPLEAGGSDPYTVAVELDIWRDGRIIRRFHSDQDIRYWTFLKNGSQVSFRKAPLHGDMSSYCTLFDVSTGKQLATCSLTGETM
jgi:hypothetical protein